MSAPSPTALPVGAEETRSGLDGPAVGCDGNGLGSQSGCPAVTGADAGASGVSHPGKGGCYLLCSEQARTPGDLHPVSGSQFKRDVELLERSQQKLR